MNESDNRSPTVRRYTSRPLLTVAILAAVIIVSLILIRQYEHFQLRPASGSAAALAEAAAAAKADNVAR